MMSMSTKNGFTRVEKLIHFWLSRLKERRDERNVCPVGLVGIMVSDILARSVSAHGNFRYAPL